MKKIILLLLLVSPFILKAQFETKGVISKKISRKLNEGTIVEFKEFIKDDTGKSYIAVLKANNEREIVKLGELENITFSYPNSREFWQIQAAKNLVFDNLLKNGLQYKLRQDLEDDALEYLRYIDNNNLIFEDSYLDSYINALVYKIYPDRLNDERPGNINVHIIKDLSPNAFIFPNGTLFITTGLLSTINSEEELIGVLSHEIAHFVLDHSIININKATQRQKRAEFWAAVATGLAAAGEVYLASTNEYYNPGALTTSTAILSYSIAESINERLGLKYSREQESSADKCAVELMNHLKIEPSALASALTKIQSYCIQTGNYMALTDEGTHPSLKTRITKIGKVAEFNNPDYDKMISFVNSFNAISEFNNQHFTTCINLAKRNLISNVPTEEDYLLLAMVTMSMYNTDEKNKEALGYINKAKQLNIYPTVNLSKQESIILLRLGKKEDAKNSLIEYRKLLDNEKLKLEKINNPTEWSYINNYINKEYEWTLKMINKVKNV